MSLSQYMTKHIYKQNTLGRKAYSFSLVKGERKKTIDWIKLWNERGRKEECE